MLFWKMKTLNIQYTTSHDNPQKYDDIWLPIVPADIIPNDVHPSPPPPFLLINIYRIFGDDWSLSVLYVILKGKIKQREERGFGLPLPSLTQI